MIMLKSKKKKIWTYITINMHLAGIWVSLGDSLPLGLIHLCRGVGCVLTNMVLFWLVFNP